MLKQKLHSANVQDGKRMAELFQETKHLQCQLDIKNQEMVDITLNALPKSYSRY